MPTWLRAQPDGGAASTDRSRPSRSTADTSHAYGTFMTADGVPALRVARWGGTSWTVPGGGTTGAVHALASMSGELVAGGEFDQAGAASTWSLARFSANGIPWLAEIMGCDGVGDQWGYTRAEKYAGLLSAQATQPGCIGAVINLEESDGGWQNDNGDGTRAFITSFRRLVPGMPLFASLDTRLARPDSPYQRVCAELCDRVMPMLYPTAFQQPVTQAIPAVLTERMLAYWRDKEIIPTVQLYGGILPGTILEMDRMLGLLYAAGKIAGLNEYTLGHANSTQWETFRSSTGWLSRTKDAPLPEITKAEALTMLRHRRSSSNFSVFCFIPTFRSPSTL